jgi:hypothetical protein
MAVLRDVCVVASPRAEHLGWFFVSIYTKASKFSFSLTSWNMWQEERSHVVSPCGVIIRLIHERKGKYLLEVSLISVTGGWQCRNDY